MSTIWIAMLLLSISMLIFKDPGVAVTSMLRGSSSAVDLAVTLTATYAFWLGFLAIMEEIGAAKLISKMLRPVINFLFGNKTSDEAKKYISMNISANILGLGNASTSMGIKAIEEMNKEKKKKASNNMIMLVVISATSLQILPSTVIGMRVANNSAIPSGFLFASIVATVSSTLIGVALVLIIQRFSKYEKEHLKLKSEKDKKNQKNVRYERKDK